jgi:hypothetical protein
MSKTTEVHCPACGETTAEQHGARCPEVAAEIGGTKFLQPAYEACRFSECGLIYKSDHLSNGELSKYHELVDYKKWEIEGHFPK